MRKWMVAALLAASTMATGAQAAVTFLAKGTLGGTSDLSGLTGTLENGLAANILGGLGSGLAHVSGNQFLALPDRGPNATSYNSKVDDTVSYISRFHTLTLDLTQSNGSFSLTPTLNSTTLLYSPDPLVYGTGAGLGLGSGAPAQNGNGVNYFTGRSDNFGGANSGNLSNARFDPESIRLSNDGRTVYISDEYGPYVRAFDRATGALTHTYALPSSFDVTNQSPVGQTEIDGNSSGRTANKGMEGLAITPDGKTLVGIMQDKLIQDANGKKLVRIVTIDIATGATKQYGYRLTSGSGVSDIVALNDHEFLVDERDGKGLGDGTTAVTKQIFKIDLNGATDISNVAAADKNTPAVSKTLFVDIVDLLTKQAGLTADQVPAKIEGISFGDDVTVNGETLHTFYVANDNDFVPQKAGENQFFVFGFKDSDLPGFAPQTIAAVPEPKSWATLMLGVGLAGGMLRRRASRLRIRLG